MVKIDAELPKLSPNKVGLNKIMWKNHGTNCVIYEWLLFANCTDYTSNQLSYSQCSRPALTWQLLDTIDFRSNCIFTQCPYSSEPLSLPAFRGLVRAYWRWFRPPLEKQRRVFRFPVFPVYHADILASLTGFTPAAIYAGHLWLYIG